MTELNAKYINVAEVIKQSNFDSKSPLYSKNSNELNELEAKLKTKQKTYKNSIAVLRNTIFTQTEIFLNSNTTIEKMEDTLSQRMIAEEIGNVLEIPEIFVTARMIVEKYSNYFLKKSKKSHDISHKKIYEQLKQIEQQIFYFNRLEKKLTDRLDDLKKQREALDKKYPKSHNVERTKLTNKGMELATILKAVVAANANIKSQQDILEKKATEFENAARAIKEHRNTVIVDLFNKYKPAKQLEYVENFHLLENEDNNSNNQQLIDFINSHRSGIKKLFTRKYTKFTSNEKVKQYLYKNGFINQATHMPDNTEALATIRLSLKNGLGSSKRYLVTDSLLSYLGMNPLRFSIGKAAELLGKANLATSMEWQKADKDIIAMMGLLRGAHRRDLIRLYFRTLELYSENNEKSDEAIIKDFFGNLESLFIQLAYPNCADRAKTFSLYHIQGLDGIKDPNRVRAINDTLYLNELKKRINHIFDRYGHTNHIKRTVKNGIPEYTIEDNVGISYEKTTIRKKKLFWKLTADAVTLLNTVGQAAFACWGLIVTGNPLFLLIFLAAFVTNFYLFLPAQRATFIDLFVRWDMNGLSRYKKAALILAFGASLLSGLFFAFMAYGGASALITISGGTALALAVGIITFIGFTSLLFAVFKSYIVNETYKATWNYIRENLLFKGFMNMTMKQRLGYVFAWAIRILVMSIAAVAATIYVAATLGKCYDTVAALFPKVPSALNAMFAITGGCIDMFFTLKSLMPIAIALSNFVTKSILTIAQGTFNITSFVILHPMQTRRWVNEKVKGIFKREKNKKEKIPPTRLDEMDEDVDYTEFLKDIGGIKDTVYNNPSRFILPLTKIAFYVLVVLFLVPVNAVGNAVTNESSADTLVDKLDTMGFHNVSNFVLGKMIIFASLICSTSITGDSSNEETLKVTPDMDSEHTEAFVFDQPKSRDALRKQANDAYKATDTMTDTAISYFEAFMNKPDKNTVNVSGSTPLSLFDTAQNQGWSTGPTGPNY